MQKFLYLSDSVYPDYDSAIEYIYLKSIRNYGYLPYIMFFTRDADRTKVFKKHNSIIILVPYKKAGIFFFSKLNNYLRFMFCFLHLVKNRKFLFVQVRNNYLFEIFTILFRGTGKYKTVYQITYPTIDAKLLKLKDKASKAVFFIKKKILISIKNFIMKRVSYVITMSDKMTEVMKLKYPKPGYHALPMGVPEGFKFDPEKEIQLKKELNLKNEKIILYFGNISKARKIEFVFQLASKFLKNNTHNIKFLILYKRALEDEIRYKGLINEMGLSDLLIFKEEVPREVVPYYIKLAYASLSPIPVTDIYIQSSPTKCVESIAYNCPVLASEIPDQISMVENSGGGYICKYSVDAFYEKLNELLNKNKLRDEIAMKGSDYILSNRGYNVLAKNVAKFYDGI